MNSAFKTKIYTPIRQNIELAANALVNGDIVAIPTETVYGLAANALNENAVKKIFTAKQRPSDNPLIAHISNYDMLEMLCENINEDAYILAQKFWPGPLTLVLKSSGKACPLVSAGLNTIAVRMPSHKTALEIIKAANVPLAAPSANKSGTPSPTSANDVFQDLFGKLDIIINGGTCDIGLESTVLSLASEKPLLLRPGIITKQEIEHVLNKEIAISSAITQKLSDGQKAHSPGMKYTHYSPKAKIILIKAESEKYIDYINEKALIDNNIAALCFEGEEQNINCKTVVLGKKDDAKQQAHNLFYTLRKLDEIGAKTAYAHCPDEHGISLAVYNRIIRAAAFRVIEL